MGRGDAPILFARAHGPVVGVGKEDRRAAPVGVGVGGAERDLPVALDGQGRGVECDHGFGIGLASHIPGAGRDVDRVGGGSIAGVVQIPPPTCPVGTKLAVATTRWVERSTRSSWPWTSGQSPRLAIPM